MTRRLAAVIAAAAASSAGCMRIYPDPELPDVIVEWSSECVDGARTVRVELTSSAGEVTTADFECLAWEGRVEDLDREEHTVHVAVLDAQQEVLGRAIPTTVDLRDGVSKRTYVGTFLVDEGLIDVAWTIAASETCATLGTDTVELRLTRETSSTSLTANCSAGTLDYDIPVEAGSYAAQLHAVDNATYQTVAISPLLPDVVVRPRGETTDLGTLELTRCAPSCP